MKKSSKKKSSLREITYGIPANAAAKITGSFVNSAHVDAGWIRVYVGWDDQESEYIYAVCKEKTFLLGKGSEPSDVKPTSKNKGGWVFAIDYLPFGFISERARPIEVVCLGYVVTFGLDHAKREFLSVAMPGEQLELLFRNPHSGCTEPWSKHPAYAMDNKLAINPKLTATTNSFISDHGSTGDLELDKMLAELG